LVVVAGATMHGRWLPRAAVITTAVSLLAFTAINPDGFIAEQNIQRFEATGKLDLQELSTLSGDAVPALLKLSPRLQACVLREVNADLSEADPWHSFNLGRTHARDLLAGTDMARNGSCPGEVTP
jgi:Domain of unknown function (DUF4173)